MNAPKQRGGSRSGAGRKPSGDDKKKMISIRICPVLVDKLKQESIDSQKSQAKIIEELLLKFFD